MAGTAGAGGGCGPGAGRQHGAWWEGLPEWGPVPGNGAIKPVRDVWGRSAGAAVAEIGDE
ncbi:hypothetical protein Slala05_15780 [Streptomyces lavendulae subsp. lavendulae]|nr:hypothetical protein Slala05_15780 [Streptomyces lavendulae subsp. lavendulae]